MKFDENLIYLTIEEGINKFDLPGDIGKFGNKVIISYEMLHDKASSESTMKLIRTKDIAPSEIEDWGKATKYLNDLLGENNEKYDSVKEKIQIFHNDDYVNYSNVDEFEY